MSEVIFADPGRGLTITRSATCTPGFAAFLERTEWGSGGLRYTNPRMGEILKQIPAPHFLSLAEDDRLGGVLTLSEKTVRLGGRPYPAIYSYALAVDASRRGRGYGTLLAEQALRYGLEQVGEKGIYYGYVEAENTPSLRAVQRVGRESLGVYHGLLFSRLRPRARVPVEQLPPSRRDYLLELLNREYGTYTLADLEQSLRLEAYYVIPGEDGLMAGVQCQREDLTLTHLPGLSGHFLVKVLPALPFLRRLLPGRQFRFLSFGNLYASPGGEAALVALMETLLARHGLNFGLLYLDRRSPVARRLAATGKFGIFQTLLDLPVHIMAYLKGFTPGERAELDRQPLFVSPLDPV